MRCSRCFATENIRNIKPFGLICYKCYEELVDKMLRYKDDWFDDTIFPQIKKEIIDRIRTNPDFDLDEFIKNSEYESEAIQVAIEEMICYETLPEYVRKFLHSYRSYEIEINGDLDDTMQDM